MDTFGDRLKSVRKQHDLEIPAVAEILGVDENLLQALERNEFDALPDETQVMACLTGYAECLQVDADLMIEDFVGERKKALGGFEDVTLDPVVESPPAAIQREAKQRSGSSPWPFGLGVLAIVLLVVIGALAGWWTPSQDATGVAPAGSEERVDLPPETSVATLPAEPEPEADESADTSAPIDTSAQSKDLTLLEDADAFSEDADDAEVVDAADAAEAAAEELPVESRVAQTPTTPPPVKVSDDPPTTEAAPTQSSLTITEFGVGTGVKDLQLVGENSSFGEGTQVAFWTRVRGASPGEEIDHVWLRNSTEVARISLEIGGSNWRTHSIKTLYAGSTGNWTVEARDASGRLLARTEFVCVR